MADKRTFQRFKRRMTVHFELNAQPYVGVTRDISQTGMFVLCHFTPQIGTALTILVKLPSGGDARVQGKVTRAQRAPVALAGSFPSGFGFMLTGFNQQFANAAASTPMARIEPSEALDSTGGLRRRPGPAALPNVIKVLVAHPDESAFAALRDAFAHATVGHFSADWAGTLPAVEKALAAATHDVVFVGGRFEDVGHIDVVRRARRDGWARPLFVLAEWEDPAVEAAVIGAGASGVVDRKDLEPKALTRLVRQAFHRERALVAGAEWEPRFRALAAALEDGVLVGDADGRIVFCSRPAQRILGRDDIEVLRSPLLQAFPESVRPAITAALASEEPAEEPLQTLLERPGGDAAAVELTVAGYSVTGQPRSIVLLHDVRERRELEEAVLDSETEWRDLYEKAPVGYVSLDTDGFVTLANETLIRWLGARRDVVLGRSVSELMRVQEGPSIEQLLASLKAEPAAERDVEVQLLRHHGEPLAARLQLTTVVGSEGGVVSHRAVVIDESRRQEAERQAGRLAGIVGSSADAIFSCGAGGTIETWNPGAERITGRGAAEMAGGSLLALAPPGRDGDLRAALERAGAGEPVPAFEALWIGPDGPVEVSLALSPIRDAKGEVVSVSGIARDVTARNRADRELRRLRKAVETMQVGLTITDPRGRILYVNRAGAVMAGYLPEELTGQDVGVLAGSGRRRVMSDEELRAMSSWKRISQNVRKDGSAFPVRLVSDVVLDVSGRPIGIVTISEAVSEPTVAVPALTSRPADAGISE